MMQKALSLLEMLLVLVVAAVIAIVAVRFYSEVKTNQKIQALISQYASINTAINKCLVSKRKGLLEDGKQIDCKKRDFGDLIAAGYLNPEITSNPWGSDNNGFSNKLTLLTNERFVVTSYNVPTSSCERAGQDIESKLPVTSDVNALGNNCVFRADL